MSHQVDASYIQSIVNTQLTVKNSRVEQSSSSDFTINKIQQTTLNLSGQILKNSKSQISKTENKACGCTHPRRGFEVDGFCRTWCSVFWTGLWKAVVQRFGKYDSYTSNMPVDKSDTSYISVY